MKSIIQDQNKTFLKDVVMMRLLLIVMLLMCHSFAPFCGNWTSFTPNSSNEVYFWIGKFSYSFFLEAFVFISGLLVGYQSIQKSLSKLKYNYLIKKFKRLIIPSIFFSCIYFLCFYEWNGLSSFAISILNGCGHLWFLPMLFWCFFGIWVLSYVNMNPYAILAFSLALMVFTNGFLPFRLGNAMYYFFFFFLGYLVYKEGFLKYFQIRPLFLIIYFILYVCLVILNAKYQINIKGGILIKHILQGTIGLLGIILCYSIVRALKYKISYFPKWLVILSQYSFGIYIMQQFILRALYYYTQLPNVVDFIIVPWIGFITALILSICLTYIILKFKLGRLLIG